MKDQRYADVCTTRNRVLERTAARFPDKPLFVFEDRTLTFAGFHEQVANPIT